MAHVSEFPKDLNKTYNRIMERIDQLKSPSERKLCKKVLETACFASRPLSFEEIHALAGLPDGLEASYITTRCGSFLTVHNDVVYLLHHSVGEYLTRYFEANSPGGPVQVNETLAKQAIVSMSKALEYNMYGLELGTESDTLTPPAGKNSLAAIQYSCEFWDDHLLRAAFELTDEGPVLPFLEQHFLHWLESLSLLGKLASAPSSIKSLLDMAMVRSCDIEYATTN